MTIKQLQIQLEEERAVNDLLREALIDATYAMETGRVWTGMEYRYLHPTYKSKILKYRELLDMTADGHNST